MDFQSQMSSGLNFGVMNAMRTGNPIIDILICMLIPVLLGSFMGQAAGDPMSQRILTACRNFCDWLSGTKTFIRYIEYEDRGDIHYYGNDRSALDTSEKNNILQKAIKLYTQEVCHMTLDEAELYLLPQTKIQLDNDCCGDACVFSGNFKQLQSYKVVRLPKKDHWVEIDKADPPISFRQALMTNEEGEGQGRKSVRTLTFELRARGPKAEARVDEFVDKAFEWYKQKKSDEVDRKRYLYQPMLKGGGKLLEDSDAGDGSQEERKYKRYILSDVKSFKTLFFPEKDAMLKLVEDFRTSTGKFAIPGFPNKLGLLLDGPPGTGKTSLIKALGIHLKRHIVTVSLEKVRTNQELMDMMFDLSFSVRGEDEAIKMKFDEVIFVMEDVDCASSVVYTRKTGDGGNPWEANGQQPVSAKAEPESLSPPENCPVEPPGKIQMARAQSTPADPVKYRRSAPFSTAKMLRQTSFLQMAKTLEEDDEEEGEAAEAPVPEPSAKASPLVAQQQDAEESEEEAEIEEAKIRKEVLSASSKGKDSKKLFGEDDLDKLNLSGLLNVLDGVVDSPGRVLIMTTNHPEKLDPALIRPGRINKRIHLGFVTAETLLQMAKHYVCREEELPGHAQRAAEELCNSGRGLTPAWVEQCAAEAESFDGLIRQLWVLKNAAPAGAPASGAPPRGVPNGSGPSSGSRRW